MKSRQYLGIGLGLAIAFSWVSAADARGQGAGIGYSPSKDGTYCSTKLTSKETGTRINLREGPGTGYGARHYGLPGDRVDFLSLNGNPNRWMSRKDSAGQIWYQVGFPSSHAYGWVRADFVQLPPTECRN